VHHSLIGLRILQALVSEINTKSSQRSQTQHRRIAVSFRDASLFAVFEVALNTLHVAATRALLLEAGQGPAAVAAAEAAEDTQLQLSLDLLQECLSFDFIGTHPDDSVDEMPVLQVPTAWRDRLQNGSALRLLFNVYRGCTTGRIPCMPDAMPPPQQQRAGGGGVAAPVTALTSASSAITGLSAGLMRDFKPNRARAAQTLECLGHLVSVRRSIFSGETERRKLLALVFRGTLDIMTHEGGGMGLADPQCFHLFARLLVRLKANCSLSDLLAAEGYADWLDAVAKLTVGACLRPVEASNSLPYLLNMWARLVSNIPYLMTDNAGAAPATTGSGAVTGSALRTPAKPTAAAQRDQQQQREQQQQLGPTGQPLSEHRLELYVPEVVAAFVRGWVEALSAPGGRGGGRGRLSSVEHSILGSGGGGGGASADAEDLDSALGLLGDQERLEDVLSSIPALARYQYEPTAKLLLSILDPVLQRYAEGLAYTQSNPQADPGAVLAALRVLEYKLAWLVDVVAAIISGATTSSGYGMTLYSAALGLPATAAASGSASSSAGGVPGVQDDVLLDADLATRVFQLLQRTDARLAAAVGNQPPRVAAANPGLRSYRVCAELEQAFLYFIGSFRGAYISEAAGMPSSGAAERRQKEGSALLLSAAAGGAGAKKKGPGASAARLPDVGFGMSDASPSNGGGVGEGSGAGAGGGEVSQSLQELFSSSSGRTRSFYGFFLRMGMGDHNAVVTHCILKMANNLRYWSDSDTIIQRTLDTFSNLVHSYSGGRLLLSLDAIDALLRQHTEEHFPFLAMPVHGKARTTFYTALARIVFLDDEQEKFEPFFQPFASMLERLGAAVQQVGSSGSAAARGNPELATGLICISRDLRGLLLAAHNHVCYQSVFDAIFPRHVQMLSRALDLFADSPAVANTILKVFSELVHGPAQRIRFGSNSAQGLLLFREAMNAVTVYGRRALRCSPPATDAYALKYKGIGIAISVVARALDGGYVNTGVFGLYGDPCLDQAMDVIFQLALGLSPKEIMEFPKLARWHLSFLHLVTRSHMEVLVALPASAFQQVVQTLVEGLDQLDQEVALQSAFAIDCIATYFVNNFKKDSPVTAKLRAHVAAASTMFSSLMKVLFNILVWGEALNLRGMGRPLLSVILAAELLQPDCFEQFRQEIIAAQPADVRTRMVDEFSKLMRDITRSLDFANRDRFDSRLTMFRLALKDFAKY
jgi:hypothetical protein